MSSEHPAFDYCVLAHWVSLGWLYSLHPRYRSIVGYTILSGATLHTIQYTQRKEPNSTDEICLVLLDILTQWANVQ